MTMRIEKEGKWDALVVILVRRRTYTPKERERERERERETRLTLEQRKRVTDETIERQRFHLHFPSGQLEDPLPFSLVAEGTRL